MAGRSAPEYTTTSEKTAAKAVEMGFSLPRLKTNTDGELAFVFGHPLFGDPFDTFVEFAHGRRRDSFRWATAKKAIQILIEAHQAEAERG